MPGSSWRSSTPEGPPTRDQLRAVGDYINHAIFTDEELDGGLARLREAGHAIEQDGRFVASPQALSWYGQVASGKSRDCIHKDLERVQGRLAALADF